jgi:5-methylcytosine-specific restriction endonuclease McrA
MVRDKFTCQICHQRFVFKNEHDIELPDTKQMAIDHIHPYSKGGITVLENLQVLCRRCNAKKRDKINYAVQAKMPLEANNE